MPQKTVKVTCRIKGQVETADEALSYLHWEALEDAVDDLGDVTCLDLINKQNKTDSMNACREAFRDLHDPKMTKGKLRTKAMAMIPEAEMLSAHRALVAGNPSELEALIATNTATIQADHAA